MSGTSDGKPGDTGEGAVLPRPYFEGDGVAIFHADCHSILPAIDPSSVDLVLTDPPYGINYVARSRAKASSDMEGMTVVGDDEPFDPRHLLAFGRCVIFGANYFAHLLPPGGWFVWSKAQDNRWARGTASTRSLAEVAWTNCHNHVALYNCFWAGSPLYRQSERGSRLHPTQKPVELMSYIIDRCSKPGALILDPYMGSGPVAKACAELGRRYIGCEVEERYCAAAVGRLDQRTLLLEPPSAARSSDV